MGAYRDETVAIRQKLEEIEDELARLDRAETGREALAAQAELLRSDLSRAHARSPLHNLRIAAPCNESWEDMIGDNRVRHCCACNKNVFNISGMSHAEALELLETRNAGLCVRMYKRADGTVMTNDCPVGESRRKVRRLAMFGAGLAGLAGVAFNSWSDRSDDRMMMGAAPSDERSGGYATGAAPAWEPPPAGSTVHSSQTAAPSGAAPLDKSTAPAKKDPKKHSRIDGVSIP